MKALNGLLDGLGITEAGVVVGMPVSWGSTEWASSHDVISYVERDANGKIVGIAFASWLKVFNPRMKLWVSTFQGPTPYKSDMAQVGHWFRMMVEKGFTVTLTEPATLEFPMQRVGIMKNNRSRHSNDNMRFANTKA